MMARLKLVSLVAVAFAVGLAACSSSPNLQSLPCQTAADCPAGQGCGVNGYCAPLLGSAGVGGDVGASAGTTTGATTAGLGGSTGHGGLIGGSSSGGAVNGSSSGGQGIGTSTGSQFGGTSTGTSTSAGNGSSTGGGPSCGCSASCCSEQASASSTAQSGGLTCPDGSTCYGSWYCNLAPSGGCTQTDPCNGRSGTYVSCSTSSAGTTGSASSSSSSSSSGGSSTGGGTTGTITGTIGPQGGSVSSLVFGVVGDTRPQNEGDTANYPTQDITWIYQNIMASSPRPQFVIGTGDYAYCSGSDCAAQTADYITAAKQYYPGGGQIFLAMGNHECNGYTSSNCAPDAPADGATSSEPNYTNFFNVLNTFGINSTSQPTLSTGVPYYEVDVSSSDSTNPWTAKFVMIAANAWDSGQSSWLTSVMQKQTTYTFVVRHESYQDDGAANSDLPGDQGASDAIIQQYPYTLLLVGHTHEYAQSSSGSGQVELIVGNGGAETSGPPGYVICAMVSGGNISCQPYAAGSSASTNGSAVVVNATGALQ